MYMVTICDRNLKVHYLEALAVPCIYTGPAAICPKDLRTRFMRTYTPLSKELHQTGAATDVCIGADYPHLQPKHIEQEMDGPLHVLLECPGALSWMYRTDSPLDAQDLHNISLKEE
jgi:hypothetical protein